MARWRRRPASSDVTEGLRARDPREMAAFLDIWAERG